MLPEWVGLLPGQVPILSRVGHPPILARNGKSSWDRLKVFLGPAHFITCNDGHFENYLRLRERNERFLGCRIRYNIC
jgi:hypothetical protein